MEAIHPSHELITALRSVAQTGFAHQSTKELGAAAGWRLVDDEFNFGYVAFYVWLGLGEDARSRLVVEISDSGRPSRAFISLFAYEEYEVERRPFDEVYQSIAERLTGILGAASQTGTYIYPHRKGWRYLYSWWSLSDSTFVLVQDEFDIQFGMDVSLWVLPAGAAILLPVHDC